MHNSCLASELICSVPVGIPVQVTTRGYESRRALYIPLTKDSLWGHWPSAHKFIHFPLDCVCFTTKYQSRILSLKKHQDKLTAQTVFCRVMLCQVRLPSDLPVFHCCCPLGCQTVQSFNPRSFLTVTGICLSGLFFFPSVSLDNNVNQQKYCLIIDKINLYGAKCKGK